MRSKSISDFITTAPDVIRQTPYGQRHAKRDIRTYMYHIVQTQISPYTILKTSKRNPIVYTARNICATVVPSVKKCRPYSDAASETQRLVWVYTFCMCIKVPFRMTLAICLSLAVVITICNDVYNTFWTWNTSNEFMYCHENRPNSIIRQLSIHLGLKRTQG